MFLVNLTTIPGTLNLLVATELEHKFTLTQGFPGEEALASCLAHLDLRLEPGESRVQHDRYFDSPAGTLRKAGYRLRQRHIGERRLATLKSVGTRTGSLRRREELELPLEGGGWPAAIRERLAPLVRLEDLAPWLELTTRRQPYLIYRDIYGDDRKLAELAYDQVQAAQPGSSRHVSFEEVELEALAADEGELNRLAGALAEVGAFTPSRSSKLGRARTLLGLK